MVCISWVRERVGSVGELGFGLMVMVLVWVRERVGEVIWVHGGRMVRNWGEVGFGLGGLCRGDGGVGI